MKRAIAMLLLALCAGMIAPAALAQTHPEICAQPEMPEIPKEWNEVTENAPMTAEEFKGMSFADWVQKAKRVLHEQAHLPLNLLAKLCGLLLLAAVGQGMCTQRASQELTELVDIVSALTVFSLCVSPLLSLTQAFASAIDSSRTYIISFVPVFASTLTACGQVGGAALYSGFFFSVSMVIADVLYRTGIPLTRILLALNAAASVGGTVDLSKMTASVCKWIKWLLSFCATIFGACIGLQSIFAQSADSLALKTGKFILSSSIPVVGHAISDAMGSVLSGMKLLKGTIGFALIAVLAASFVPLLVRCFAYHIVFSIGELVASATGSGKCAKLLSGLSECVSLYISMIFFFGLIVITSTILMILLGNGG